MSVFKTDDNDDTNVDINLDGVTLDTLVGDTQKYKTPDDLAKAYAHAEARLSKMKAELVEANAERKVLKDLADTRNKSEDPSKQKDDDGNQRQEDPLAGGRPKENVNDKDLSTLVTEKIEELNTQKNFSDNVNSVSEKLASYFGGEREAKAAVAKKAKELNVGIEWLMDVAGRSPTAFYSTIGIDQKSFSTPASQGDVNTAAFSKDANRRNFKYYEELRKTTPKVYYSAQVQREMFNAAREQGDKFYT